MMQLTKQHNAHTKSAKASAIKATALASEPGLFFPYSFLKPTHRNATWSNVAAPRKIWAVVGGGMWWCGDAVVGRGELKKRKGRRKGH